MRNITFVSRYNFINIIQGDQVTNDFALISISDNEVEELEMRSHIESNASNCNYITLNFQDVDHHDGTGISDKQATSLFKFIKENDGKKFLVHCFAGISRSAAIAKFIDEYYDFDDPVLNSYSIYNKLVYSKLTQNIGAMSLRDYYEQLEQEDRRDSSI